MDNRSPRPRQGDAVRKRPVKDSHASLEPITPMFSASPRAGQTLEVAPGVHWLRTSLPFRLNAVNLWLLEDGDSWTMVDCGYPLPEVQAQIEAAWSHLLGGRPIRRLIVTHHHPDHVGNCRWICDRWDILPSMSQGEYKKAQALAGEGQNQMQLRTAFWQRHGLSAEIGEQVIHTWRRGVTLLQPLKECRLLADGHRLQIGDYEWQIIVARGHSPEQLLLYSSRQKLLISGDQVLNPITPNVSVPYDAPESDPLGLFLQSNLHIAENCDEAAVLPSHKQPFRGLHRRILDIEEHHHARLEKVETQLRKAPATAASILPALFGHPDKLTAHEIGFAIGETIAHLNCLVATGRAIRNSSSAKIVFTST